MKLMPLRLTAAIVSALALTHCGSSSSGSTAADASTDGSVGSDGSSQDDSAAAGDGSSPDDGATVADVSVADSGGGDSGGGSDSGTGTGTGDANQTPCDPNDPSTCATGAKCCSEPTHMNPPTVYECVPPEANGACPMYP